MATIRGDFAKLHALIQKLEGLSGPSQFPRISRAMGEEVIKRVRKGFQTETDPYGAAWAPRSPKTRVKGRAKGRILRRSGALYKSFVLVSANYRGFVIASDAPYASVHQDGADYTAAGRVTFRTKKGRFQRTQAGIKAAQRQKRVSGAVAAHGSHRIVIPRRLMLPLESRGLGTWEARLVTVARREVSRILRGR